MHSRFDTPHTAPIAEFTNRANVPPCPFCGSTFLRVHIGHEPHVSCMQCGTDGPRPARAKDNPDAARLAINAWCARVKEQDHG